MDGDMVDTVRDTGATTTFVDGRLVPKDAKRGPKCQVAGIEAGFRSTRPTALIDLSTPYFKGKVWAVALEDPAYSLVIGNVVDFEDGTRREVAAELPDQVLVGATTRAQAQRGKEPLRPELHPADMGVGPERIKDLQRKDPTLAKVMELAGKPGKVTGQGEVRYQKRGALLKKSFSGAQQWESDSVISEQNGRDRDWDRDRKRREATRRDRERSPTHRVEDDFARGVAKYRSHERDRERERERDRERERKRDRELKRRGRLTQSDDQGRH